MYQTLQPNQLCREYQVRTCELFEERGHPTVLSDRLTEKGYVHGLAHGIGLDVHESPGFRNVEGNDDLLLPGSVITLEPGLYYPERGMGVRIEDTLWVRPDGTLETLVEFPKDLVLTMP
jgi:Xaa-Pro aminopeptidase